MEPRIVEKEAFVLAGVRKHTRDGWQVIGEAWCELKSQMDRLPRVDANGEIGKAFRYIYDVWLPNSEYCLPEELCADFEYYDERWNCQNKAAQMDIYIPIKKMIE